MVRAHPIVHGHKGVVGPLASHAEYQLWLVTDRPLSGFLSRRLLIEPRTPLPPSHSNSFPFHLSRPLVHIPTSEPPPSNSYITSFHLSLQQEVCQSLYGGRLARRSQVITVTYVSFCGTPGMCHEEWLPLACQATPSIVFLARLLCFVVDTFLHLLSGKTFDSCLNVCICVFPIFFVLTTVTFPRFLNRTLASVSYLKHSHKKNR